MTASLQDQNTRQLKTMKYLLWKSLMRMGNQQQQVPGKRRHSYRISEVWW